MLATSLKKVSQSAAIAAFGVAMVAAAGAAPASAVSLSDVKLYNLSVDWGNGTTASGYYYVKNGDLPLTTGSGVGVNLPEYDVTVTNGSTLNDRFFNSSITNSPNLAALNNTLNFGGIFQAGIVNPVTGPNVALSFTNTSPFKQLTLQIPSTPATPFTGAIAPGTIVLADFLNTSQSVQTNPNGVPVTSVPEPLTIAGTAVAGAMGLFLKRKQKASSAA
ncbi:MAG: PEP-CTERM sorting domain-containing protein [Gloeotrichia echinulata IR180]|jgi:hypothetical protein